MGVQLFRPRNASEIGECLRASRTVLIRGGGSKAGFGRVKTGDETVLDLGALEGIMVYEPDELVLTAQAGTKLADIAAALEARGQHMAFEPPDFSGLFETNAGSTLGGMVASGWSGPRRIKSGAVRDHVLGAIAIGGEGQIFRSGGRVVKNVTGFDLPKLLTGSHGSLAVVTELTIKVLPVPQAVTTLLLLGLDAQAAMRAMSDALGGPYDVSGASHLPAAASARSAITEVATAGTPVTALRLEGFGPSVGDRFRALEARFAAVERRSLASEDSAILWREIRDLAALIEPDAIIWRLSVPPTDGARTVVEIARRAPCEAVYDWGGGLIWLMFPPGGDVSGDGHAALVRDALPAGHATLMRASDAVRAVAPIFQPQPAALAALTGRVRAAFDPGGLFASGPV
jgi:glycolate oxidase FAD binding subunit